MLRELSKKNCDGMNILLLQRTVFINVLPNFEAELKKKKKKEKCPMHSYIILLVCD